MATFDIGQPTFSLQQAKIAAWNGDGTYGTAFIVPSIKIFGIDLKTITDTAQGDSRITAVAAQAISADIAMDVAGISFQALAIMTGVASTTSGAALSQKNYMDFTNFRFPYWGVVGQAWAAESAGDTLFFLPKVKITSGFSFKFEFGKIVVPQFKAMGIADDLYGGDIFRLVERAAVAAYALPPI